MAEKVAGGAWHEGGPEGPRASRPEPEQSEEERLTAQRNNARWTAAVGFLMLFAASFSVAFATGGVVMVAYGVGASVYWSRRLRRLKGDPWAYDPELDGPRFER